MVPVHSGEYCISLNIHSYELQNGLSFKGMVARKQFCLTVFDLLHKNSRIHCWNKFQQRKQDAQQSCSPCRTNKPNGNHWQKKVSLCATHRYIKLLIWLKIKIKTLPQFKIRYERCRTRIYVSSPFYHHFDVWFSIYFITFAVWITISSLFQRSYPLLVRIRIWTVSKLLHNGHLTVLHRQLNSLLLDSLDFYWYRKNHF